MSENPSTGTDLHHSAGLARDAILTLEDQAKEAARVVTDFYNDHESADAEAAYYAVKIAQEQLMTALGHLQKIVDRSTPSPWDGVTGR